MSQENQNNAENQVQNNCASISRLLDILHATNKKYDIEKITSAYTYAAELHEGQFRASGEPYISHPIAVAEIVAGLELDTDSICAALLHDTVEDCSEKTNLTEIEKKFGPVVASLVDGLTKIVNYSLEDKEEQNIENLRKMLLAMSKDVRVIFIKLCDRLHNMRTLDAKPEQKRRTTALETMQVYAPLAHRLGMQRIKQELENLSLKYLDPIGYGEIGRYIEDKYGKNYSFMEKIREEVSAKMEENKIHYTIEGRIKSVYSLYNKMYNLGKTFDEIYDFYALRIIVDTELECYTALGLIHEMYNSVPGRFKDYISTPKSNMYRSLHTTVIGHEGIPFEVQIRTWEMHQIAEYGVCAHWKYKSGTTSQEEMDKKLEWIARLLETEEDQRDPEEFLSALKTDMFHDEVFVFTPKGDVMSLPNGANVIDFAYTIHSAIGERMIGGKINGNIVPIDKTLSNGDIVEIITSSSAKGPSRDWLNIVKTASARSKIRAWFKKEKRADNILVGKSSFDNEVKHIWKASTEKDRTAIAEILAPRYGFNNTEDFYNALGYGGITLSKINIRLTDETNKKMHESQPAPEPVAPLVPITEKPRKIKSDSGIVVDGEEGCMVKFAKCCNPLPGDPVIGFITKGFGISIHKKDCPNAINGKNSPENADRWKDAYWEKTEEAGNKNSMYEAILQILAEDRIGMLADLSTALADMRVSILSVGTSARSNGMTGIMMKIGCRNIEHYNTIVARIKSLNGVYDVTRGFV